MLFPLSLPLSLPLPPTARLLLGALAGALALGGCGLPQSETCARYVECQQAYDDSVDTSAWAEDGRCWVNPRTAALCDAQCEEALEALGDVPDPPKACAQ